MAVKQEARQKMKRSRHLRVALTYLLIGAIWIFFSDLLVDSVLSTFESIPTRLQTIKGLLFVMVTGTLLYFILKREMGQLETSETSLRESNRRFTSLVENLNGMVYQGPLDARRPLTYASSGAWRLTGYRPEQLTEAPAIFYADIVHPDDRDAVWRKIGEAVRQHTTYQVTYRLRTAQGQEKWVWEQGRGVTNDGGKALILEGMATDITQLRDAETRLEAFQKIVEASPMVVCLWKNTRDWPFEMISKNTPQLFGYEVDELVSGSIGYRDIVHPDDLESLANEITAYAKAESTHPSSQQYRIITKEGAVKWVEHRTLIRRDSNGRISHFQGIVFDITVLKKEEQKILELQNQLLQAQKLESVGRLAGGVAHDFNNLLSVVIGYSELLLDDHRPGHPHLESLSAILDAGQRAKVLTRQLLAFGRKQMLDASILDINTVIANFQKLLARVLGEDIAVVLMLDKTPCMVKADLSQLEQILMNLAVNARDAMPNGGTLTIESGVALLDEAYTAVKPEATAGPHVMISISDTGTGMEKGLIDYIFEPFFTTKDSERGTGLGLSTVYGIVKQHGGNIWVYSEPGQGTTFRIYLPEVQTAAEEKGDDAEKPIAAPPGEPHLFAATILVVEDDEAVRRLVSTVLGNWGHKVLESKDAANAIDIARSHAHPIDLLLTDVVMPGMKGPEVYKQILPLQPDIKVLYMSGYTENVVFKQGMLAKGFHFIQKPFAIKTLADKMAQILFK
jgi:two-component system, cell cycle sensor histidine kinase and response regulator CckA